jgi:V8-like Glu-specific endopeptidase
MNRYSIRGLTGIIGIFLLLVTLLAVSGERGTASAIDSAATDGEQYQSEEIPVHFNLTEDPENNQPWTDERMAAAQPYPLVRVPGSPGVYPEFTQPDGEPGMIPSSPPSGTESVLGDVGDAALLSPEALIGYNISPPPYIRYKNFDSYLEFPYSTVGVIFFRQGDNDYRCSAVSIGNNAIWTAGHCIHKGDGSGNGGKSTNIRFYPAYKNGNKPYGEWIASDSWTTPQWQIGNISYDMGGAKILPNGDGDTLSEVVGSLGFAFNLPEEQHWFNIGYPSLPPFDGKWQYICAASFAYRDTSPSIGPPLPVGMGCDMTPGSSGGPWIINFSGEAGSVNYLNGNNSYRWEEPEEMFSPYFGDEAKNLWDQLTLP